MLFNELSAKEKADITYRDIQKRITEKKYKQRKAVQEAIATSTEGFERCARGRWRAGQQ